MVTTEQLRADLAQCIGSTELYRHSFSPMLFTEGIQAMAERAGAYWLIDVIASYQGYAVVKAESFQLWTLAVGEDRKAVVEMRSDCDQPALLRQKIPYTDFPVGQWKFYVVDGTLMIPSEY